MNFQRLKCYIDGDKWVEYGEGTDTHGDPVIIDSDPSYEGRSLAVDQGPTSPRFELVKQLLNEPGAKDGPFPANEKNPWGYDNLEVVKRVFPAQDGGVYRQARQFVANLIDYLDGDIIPTTNGDPGAATPGDTTSGAHPSLPSPVISTLPAAPTVLGVEARLEKGDLTYKPIGIRGHPYITYVGQGFVFSTYSTRVFGTVRIAYPWTAAAKVGKARPSIIMWRCK